MVVIKPETSAGLDKEVDYFRHKSFSFRVRVSLIGVGGRLREFQNF
jgi:hypothetical protein